jgi:hypothetical protein
MELFVGVTELVDGRALDGPVTEVAIHGGLLSSGPFRKSLGFGVCDHEQSQDRFKTGFAEERTLAAFLCMAEIAEHRTSFIDRLFW